MTEFEQMQLDRQLRNAFREENVAAAKAALAKGANINRTFRRSPVPCIFIAFHRKNIPMISLAIRAGASPLTTWQGRTMADYARNMKRNAPQPLRFFAELTENVAKNGQVTLGEALDVLA